MLKELKLVTVEVKLPPEENLVSALRLLVSGLGARLGFTTDELEDLKFAVGEAFLAVAERSKGQKGLITVRWEETPNQLSVIVSDPARAYTSVATSPIYAILQRVAETVVHQEGDKPGVTIYFRRDSEKRSSKNPK